MQNLEPKRRTIDPQVASRRACVAGLTAQKAPAEAIKQARQDLDAAKRLAAIRSAVRNAPPLTGEQLDDIVGMLRAAGGAA